MMPTHIAIFCQVVDNYGDIGVSWRLARQWASEAGLQITLWVDDWLSFQKICAELDPALPQQTIAGVRVRHWLDVELAGANGDGASGASRAIGDSEAAFADVVLEMFGCTLPEPVLSAMQATRPLWINLDYLSAEDWVEGCHGAASPQVNGMTRYFFFPGFTSKTGGLLAERDLPQRRDAFLADAAQQARFWQDVGVSWPDMSVNDGTGPGAAGAPAPLLVSLFCYPGAPVAKLLDLWAGAAQGVRCLVPQGVASRALLDYWQTELQPGRVYTRGMLSLQIIPFVDQPDYDRLLWACDLNFVRGEDSFVRAQWAGKPFIWHIYPQEEAVHLDKLRAFMARYTGRLTGAGMDLAADAGSAAGGRDADAGRPDTDLAAALYRFALGWNGGDEQAMQLDWPALIEKFVPWRQHSVAWAQQLAQNGNLADNLLQFIQKIV
jgi:uncharacterized repeat protein (TIGR03837 family)